MANAFTLVGTPVTTSTPSDPSLCRVSGDVIDIFGGAYVGVVFYVRHIYSPLSVGTSRLILRERKQVRSDASGQVSFDVLQGAVVRIEVTNQPNLEFEVTVPTQSSINLADLILPYIVSVTFDDGATKGVLSGESFSLPSTGLLSNGQSVDTSGAVTLTSSDAAVVTQPSNGTFTALSLGTSTITMTAVDETLLDLNNDPSGDPIVRLSVPATTLAADLVVTVS